MDRFINFGFLLVAMLVAMPAWSQIYKWVDENGVTNYTNQPPPNGKAQELDLDSVRLSVIETDKPEQLAAMAARYEVGSLRQRVNELEDQLEAQRYASQYAAEYAAGPVEAGYGYTYPYAYPGYFYAPATTFFNRNHFRKPHVRPTRFIGTPAGNGQSFNGMQRTGFQNRSFPVMMR